MSRTDYPEQAIICDFTEAEKEAALEEISKLVDFVFFGIDEDAADPLGDKRFEYDGYNDPC